MEKWVEIRKGGNFEQIGRELSVSPVVARIMKNRGLESTEEMHHYLYGNLSDLFDPHLLKDADRAVELLLGKIREHKKIRVIGDYDIDGVCASYILKTALNRCGAEADCALPHRVRDGYGLSRHLIEQAKEDGVDTILTCDNGIAAGNEILYGKQLGMMLIVTDHHEVPFTEADGQKQYLVPEADAVVNPRQPGCGYPFKELCGAAVAWKLVLLLFEAAGIGDAQEFLEFAAFATVGDVMPLTGENRILVRYGLERLKHTQNLGMRALLQACRLDEKERITTYHVGFVLGPCINATGRLDTAENAIRLFEAGTECEAAALATGLKQVNDTRKVLTEEYLEAAQALVESGRYGEDKVLVVHLPQCHESLAGIIAGRLRERYSRPVFVLTDTEDGVKGSGRSIDAYNMYEELTKCSGLFTKYGGHHQAAGLSMPAGNVEKFRAELNRNTHLREEDLHEKVAIDLVLPFDRLSRELIADLERLEPCGMGNRRPVFAARNVTLSPGKIFGKNGNVFKCMAKDDSGRNVDAVWFGDVQKFLSYKNEHEGLHLIYSPQINEYNGNSQIQITIQKYQ